MKDRRQILLLGLPTLGMAASVTAVSSYLPVVARGHAASTTVIGGILATEGLLALWLPIVVGSWSDRLRTRIGGRLPFVIVGTPAMIVSLLLFGFVGSLLALAALVVLFFLGYFVAYEPYRALYPDLVPDSLAGRSQSMQAGWRGAGTGIALISGGLLLSIAEFVPFVAYAALLGLTVALFVRLSLRRRRRQGDSRDDTDSKPGPRPSSFTGLRLLLRERPALRHYVVCNALWEAALAAIKTFVVLYVTVGLGYSLDATSGFIGAASIVVLVGALASGSIADRRGLVGVMEVSVMLFGLGVLVPGITTDRVALVVAVPVVALAGGTLMSLPYSLLMPLMPDDQHGALTGLYALSRGVGVILGPLCAGIAIDVAGPLFSATKGYAAIFWIAGMATLLSLIPLHRLRDTRRDAAERPAADPA